MAQFTTYWSGSETYKSEIKRFQSYFRSVLTKQQYQSRCLGEMNASHIAVLKCSYMYRNTHTDIKSISHISCMYKSGALWMIIDELGILQLWKRVVKYLLVLLPSAQGRPKSAIDCFISLPLNLQALAASILSKRSEDLLFYPSLVTKWWFFFFALNLSFSPRKVFVFGLKGF